MTGSKRSCNQPDVLGRSRVPWMNNVRQGEVERGVGY
jgi:hypothetical protein